MKKFLHIIQPDPKFPQLMREMYLNIGEGEHEFILLGKEEAFHFSSEGFEWVNDQAAMKDVLNRSEWSGVILNGVLGEFAPYLHLLDEKIPLAWSLWGFEIYHSIYPLYRRIIEPYTKKVLRPSLFNKLKGELSYIRWLLRGLKPQVKEVLKRVNVVVCLSREEFKLFEEKGFLDGRQQFCQAPSLHLGQMVDLESPIDDLHKKLDIQVGNSAYPASNHIDVFRRLSQEDLFGRKVIVPLSYGDKRYRDLVVSEGERILGGHFVPLIDFMPLAEYCEVTKNCGTVILNVHRQQAVGNTILALWQGNTVYMGKNAPFYTFKRWGMEVFSFEKEFDLNRTPLSVQQIQKTRGILIEKLGEEKVKERLKGLLHKMVNLRL